MKRPSCLFRISREILFAFGIIFAFIFSCHAYQINPCQDRRITEAKASLSLVFCSLHYEANKDFTSDTERFIRYLGLIPPFTEFKGKIRIYRIELSKGEESIYFQQKQGIPPLRVREDFLTGIAERLKGPFKLIIVDGQGFVSCAELSSIEKISLLILGKERYPDMESFSKGFLHELGHSLGLRDESPKSGDPLLAGEPNCAATKEEALSWWGDLVEKDNRVDYIAGCCGNSGYIRPTTASLMNNPYKADDFGPVNERYLRKAFSNNAKK